MSPPSALVRILGGYKAATDVLVLLFLYNTICLFMFATLYYAIGFEQHFNLPEDMEPSFKNCLYYSLATQATCMAGEVTPKTPLGRGVLSFQITSAYLATLVLIVPWVRQAIPRT